MYFKITPQPLGHALYIYIYREIFTLLYVVDFFHFLGVVVQVLVRDQNWSHLTFLLVYI